MELGQIETVGFIVLGGIALIAFGKPFIELNTVIVELKETVKALKELLNIFDKKNTMEHNELFDNLREHDQRITKLEAK